MQLQGLFNETIPVFLGKQSAYGAADNPITFLHFDMDLYRGASDVFKYLGHKLIPGTVLVFDDLVNTQYYRS